MKLLTLAAALLTTTALLGQSSHSVTLNWTPSVDGGTVTVYRADAPCATNPTTFTAIKTGVTAAGPFTDEAIAVGGYCYRVTAVVNGAESVPSNTANATVLPQSPTQLVITAAK